MELDGELPFRRLIQPQAGQEDIDEYRRLSADIAAGVAVVGTVLRGRDYAATVSAYLSVSYDPPTLLVSLYAESRIGQAVAESGSWALSLLGSNHQGTANWLASPGTPLEGLLAGVRFRRGPLTGAAVIDGALAYFEVRTTAIHTAATHLLVVGEVISLGDGGNSQAALDPLVHFGAAYRRLAP